MKNKRESACDQDQNFNVRRLYHPPLYLLDIVEITGVLTKIDERTKNAEEIR